MPWIRAWEEDRARVANGMPEGDPSDLPPAPQFSEGWRIPDPDETFYMTETDFKVPAEGTVDYQHFRCNPGWTEDKYIYAAEARPGNAAVVHHILIYILPPNTRVNPLESVLVGYAPGSLPINYQDGTAIKVPAGSTLLFEMHYTPNGTEQTDRSYAGVCFMDASEVEREVEGRIAIKRRGLVIEPQEADQEFVAEHQVKKGDRLLLSMTPHMHLRGKSFTYTAHYPEEYVAANPEVADGEVLLDVPNYDFNWQLKYILQEPKFLPQGTRIKCRAVFDNSANNPFNPNHKVRVEWGEQSYDEMLIGFMDMVPPADEDSEIGG